MISGLKGFDGKIATKDRFLPCCEKVCFRELFITKGPLVGYECVMIVKFFKSYYYWLVDSNILTKI